MCKLENNKNGVYTLHRRSHSGQTAELRKRQDIVSVILRTGHVQS